MKKAFVIVGPTAAGKTTAAIELALRYDTEIISADSRQCYRELNIGVARPSMEELSSVKHHFIATHSIYDPLDAGKYEKQSLEIATEIFSRKDHVVVVGGTGLYIKAFCEGIDEIPAGDPDIRRRVISGYESNGMEWLQNELKTIDPEFYEKGETKNPHRMMRALEIALATGRSIYSFQTKTRKKREFEIIKYGLQLPKEKLVTNIALRTKKMIRDGLVEEARSLLPDRQLGPLQTVGYVEMFSYLDGMISLEKAVDLINTHTWQYAKRQYTWFRKDPEVRWE